jgi:hypothetical protein
MKSTLSLILIVVAVLAGLVYLSSTGKKPPPVPRNALHAGLDSDGSCVPCHGPGERSPIRDTHPPKEQCLVCHARESS